MVTLDIKMILTRRLFMFGSASALAAAKLLPGVWQRDQTVEMIAPLSPPSHSTRRIYDIMFQDLSESQLKSYAVEWIVKRHGSDIPLLNFSIDSRAFFRWTSKFDRNDIILLPSQVLQIIATPDSGNKRVMFCFADARGRWIENTRWRNGELNVSRAWIDAPSFEAA